MIERSDKTIAPGVWVNPGRQSGRPCISPTRIATSSVKSLARAGYSVAQIRREYPDLTFKQLAEALAFEARPAAEKRELSRCIPYTQWRDIPSVGH